MITRIDKDYAKYFGLDNSIDLENKRRIIPIESWIEKEKAEKANIANIIKAENNCDNLIELCNCYYIDSNKKILSPTISEGFGSTDGYATIISPNINTRFSKKLSIIRSSAKDYKGTNERVIKNSNLNTCVIAEDNLEELINLYKIWIKKGLSCAYVISKNHNTNDMSKEKYVDSLLVNAFSHNKSDKKKYSIRKIEIENSDDNRSSKLYLINKKRINYHMSL